MRTHLTQTGPLSRLLAVRSYAQHYPDSQLAYGAYNEIIPDWLLLGPQPVRSADIAFLKVAQGVEAIVSLQQQSDATQWGVDVDELNKAMEQHGITFIRAEAVDFDSESLCKGLPKAAQAVARQLAQQRKVYVHCTAGVHRAPSTCVSYLHWFHDLTLDEAYDYVKRKRSCDPDKAAVRAATRMLALQDADQAEAARAQGQGFLHGLSFGRTAAERKQDDSTSSFKLSEEGRQAIQRKLLGSELQGRQPALPDYNKGNWMTGLIRNLRQM